MRTRNELERLAAAGQLLLSDAEPLLVAGEEDRILQRIVGSDRRVFESARRRRLKLALAVVAVVAVAVSLASVELARHGGSEPQRRDGLTGPTISLAGYHFRTPAGFHASSSSCGPSATDRFSAAASADGGCVEAFFLISSSGSPVPAGSEPVDVGAYQGHLVSSDDPEQLELYVDLPPLGDQLQDVVLFGQRLTAGQLVAIAESGLPATPSATVG